ncbi:MAG: 3-hydroxyacyl-CoA dehydrogenase NAD-binding domain-containing protein [Myxococcota bacterium]|nr:3-hydroxyacyl-CoA dehydrogenase NAD-binding domain-containing protein [Myxococcota bacterium]
MAAPRKIGIIGAGTMGSGIAQKTAQSGLDVILMDLEQAAVDRGLGGIEKMLNKGVERGIFRPGQPEAILGRIKGTTKHADLKDCDLIVEAVFEDLEIKRNLFAALEAHVRPDTVLATNTSSFKVEKVAVGLAHPERVIGLHYFFHPAQNRLLEVIPGPQTSPKTLEAAWAFCEATGKTGIHSEDSPGFVVNRFFVPWVNETVRLLEQGVADLPTIEATAKKLLGIGMGPFELMNVTGVPISQHAASGLASELGPFYAPCDRLKEQVSSGKDWDLKGEATEKGAADVEKRYVGLVLMVAAALVEEGVSSIEDIDIGAMVGLRWRRGPFALANSIGVEKAVAAAAEVAAMYNLPLPKMLAEKKEDLKPFNIRAANLNIKDGIATITMNRPNAMNALDPDTVASLAEAFDTAAADPAVTGIVLEGRGKAFVAGADIKFFINAIDAGDIPRIVDFTRTGHELFLRIDQCTKPVVARLNGMALGGGAELALACDAIVADQGAVLGFPETGIGIYPGLGGTQRLAKRCGLGVARYLVFTGDIVPAAKAASLGLVDRVAQSGESGQVVQALLKEGVVKAGTGAGELANAGEEKAACEALFSDQNVDKFLSGSFEATDKFGEKAAKKIKSKAPIALKLANDLMNQALALPIEAGVEKELAVLADVFSTEDAREGLGSVGKARPQFKGK